jgi:hypothetical protein
MASGSEEFLRRLESYAFSTFWMLGLVGSMNYGVNEFSLNFSSSEFLHMPQF